MQLLIEISEAEYNAIKFMVDFADKLPNDDCAAPDAIDQAFEAIGRGTPLPKGHGRLIDADDVLLQVGLEDTEEARAINLGEIITMEDMDRIPTIIPADKAEQDAATRWKRWQHVGKQNRRAESEDKE